MRLLGPPRRRRPAVALVLLAGLLAVAGCGILGREPTGGAPLPFRLAIRADLAQLGIVRVAVEVDGPGIGTPITQDLVISGGTASGTVEVPAGPQRTITVRAFNAAGTETHRGSATVDVVAGATVDADITLQPLVGTVAITVKVASIAISVAPATPTVRAGEQLTLVASATDLNAGNAPVTGLTFRWTSLRPPVATIDAAGRLTALDTGTARIAVNSGAAGQVVQFRVAPGTTLLDATLTPDSAALGSGVTTQARVTLRDAGASVDSVRVTLATPAGGTGPTCLATTPVPGTTRANAAFSCPLAIAAGSTTGDWPIGSIAVYGTTRLTYDAPLLAAAGIRARLRVTP